MEDVCGGSKAGLVQQVDQGTGGGCEASALGPYLGVLDAQLILYLLKRISFRLDVKRCPIPVVLFWVHTWVHTAAFSLNICVKKN